MSFSTKFGHLAKQALGYAAPVPASHMFNSVRCMATKLFVGGLSFQTDDEKLLTAFKSFGEVTEAIVITDRESGRSRGFGFVNYTTDGSASEALSGMDGKELDGRHIRVSYANVKTGGRGFQGRYDSGGGGYGSGDFGSESSSSQV